MSISITEVVALVGVLTAFLTALVAAIGLRWNKQTMTAKDAQLDTLRQQLEALRDRTPAELQKQMIALKDLMESETTRLQSSLRQSNELLRRKSAEISEETRYLAASFGRARIMGLDDGEILIRQLHGLLYDRRQKIDYGEQELAIWTFYVRVVQIGIPNAEVCKTIVTGNPEWMLDYLITPLLGSMRFQSLRISAKEALERVFDAIEGTPFSYEVPIYREMLARAAAGYDFSIGYMPEDLEIEMAKLAAKHT